jgi:hypothetical protein
MDYVQCSSFRLKDVGRIVLEPPKVRLIAIDYGGSGHL